MTIRSVNSCDSSAGLIEKYINTAYDNVKAVADNLSFLEDLYEFLVQYGLTTNIAVKAPVQVVADTPIILSGNQTISWSAGSGDYTVGAVTGMRVLVTAQADPIQNGIYNVQLGAWTRSLDFDGPLDVVDGSLVFSAQGDAWQVDGPQYSLIPGQDPITFRDIDLFAYEAVATATQKALEAAASAAAALASETAAATSATEAASSASLALDSQTAAEGSASAASGSAAQSAQSAAASAASAVSAEEFATMAESVAENDRTFEDVATGIASVADGQFFRVIATGPDEQVSFTYYKRIGDTAAEKTTLSSSAATTELTKSVNSVVLTSEELSARTKGINSRPNVYDQDGALLGGGFFDSSGISPLNYTKDGDVNLPNLKFKAYAADAEKNWSANAGNKAYMSGSKLGGLIMGRVEIAEIPGPAGVVFVDKNFIPYACDPSYVSDQDIPVIGGNGSTPPNEKEPIQYYDLMGYRSEGQSLSLGAGNPADNPQPLSTTQPYANKGFSTSNNSDVSDTDTLIPLVEKRFQPTEGTWPAAETPCTGATNKLVEMTQQDTGLTFDKQPCAFIASSPGTGGQPIANLIKGSVSYARSMSHTTNSVRLAALEGKTFAELGACWRQGESDYRDQTSQTTYYNTFVRYMSDYIADKKAITGQLFDPIFISYQLSTHRAYSRTNPTIALALRDAALAGLTDIAYPGYIGDYYTSDHIHGTPDTYFMFSQYEGRLMYKVMQDRMNGVTGKIHRLDVIDEVRQGVFTTLYFNVPTPPLAFDTSWVTATENMGFHIRDKATLAVVDGLISSVAIAGSTRVRITTTRPLLDTEIVTYGWGKAGDPLSNGRVNGPRGNLRDSEGDLSGQSYTDSQGVVRKLHNWCVIF